MISSRLAETGNDSGNSILNEKDWGLGVDKTGANLGDNPQLSPSGSHRERPTLYPPQTSRQIIDMSAVFDFTFVPWFRSVAPYIHMHRGKTFVVGIAGEAIAAGKLPNLAQDLALIQSMGVRIVLVHGFRPQVNEQL
ncbi:MAG: Amino-acid acetyltransferase, partial [Pseudomonadota bacterium]